MVEDHYLEPYRLSTRQHGTDFGVTLWASQRAQARRFQVITEMCFLTGKRILDAGCSRGDLAAFLIERQIGFEHYTGVDALAELTDFASERRFPACRFVTGDFVADPSLLSTDQPQVITISGALNTMTDDQVWRVLDAAWAATSQSLVFNFLSDRAHRRAPQRTRPARRLDTLGLLDWAMHRTGRVALRQDYFKAGHDATILMQKESLQT